ncbi:HD domain-containing protein [Emticicia sp. CRIBPO]|uniref:HD domain-containing protein n=1 Tax=Emticicia sp. CRIBPO TaxID=2683258 RepID=UPI001412300E|nr:HD domain-containing protein [Emticicia sp. CRIBPO]NBA84191.1 HD domain-containing protein [Emticicia sp. CRIBPO]
MTNKRKIFNDPVYGFVTIPSDLIYELIEHPYFQRLRRIKQLGMAELVYPGAIHTRFQHALGAMHLMGQAITTLQSKGLMVMDIEKEAVQIAVLLHDIGHGPFSHVLEYVILDQINHEKISELLMEELDKQFDGRLGLAIKMFNGTYERPFFHQLISSQLDMDRMDYLNRDSFFTGVAEGKVGVDRIIKMLHVVDNQLVVEEKGLLSVENFLNARRLMYWQVYLHKTAICAESMLIRIFERVRFLQQENLPVEIPGCLETFIINKVSLEDFVSDNKYLKSFVLLDDIDIWYAIKKWQFSEDHILSQLSKNLIRRRLFKINIGMDYQSENDTIGYKEKLRLNNIPEDEMKYYFYEGSISNSGYFPKNSNINILTKNRQIIDVSEASDLPTIKALSNIVKKNYLCYANDVYL